MAAVAAGAAAVVTFAAILLAAQGVLGGLVDVVLHQDVSYVQLTNGPGGSIIPSASTATRAMYTGLLGLRLAVPLALLGMLAWRASRRGRFWTAVVGWWVGCDLAGAMVSSRGFPHYAQQLDAALAVGAAMVATAAWRRRRVGRMAAVLAVAATFPILQLATSLPAAEVAMADQQALPTVENGSFRASQVSEYYRLSWLRLTGSVSSQRYEALFPADVARRRAVVDVLHRYSRPGDRVFVWGTVHWSYALSDRLPAGRYVSLNTAYLVDPGSERRLVSELAAHPPVVLVVDSPLPTPVQALLVRLGDRRVSGLAGGDDVWLAPAVPNRPAGS